MIPYEELVVALQTWRAKKGLPITQMSGSFAPPPAAAAPTPPPARTAPPTPAPRAKPAAPPQEHHETIDAASLLDEEDSYQNEGNDFAMEFPHNTVDEGEGEAGESTQIGSPPSRPSDLATDPGFDSVARGNKRNTDW